MGGALAVGWRWMGRGLGVNWCKSPPPPVCRPRPPVGPSRGCGGHAAPVPTRLSAPPPSTRARHTEGGRCGPLPRGARPPARDRTARHRARHRAEGDAGVRRGRDLTMPGFCKTQVPTPSSNSRRACGSGTNGGGGVRATTCCSVSASRPKIKQFLRVMVGLRGAFRE